MIMKRIGSLILLLGLFKSVTGVGQVYIEGVVIDTLNTPYCQLICTNGGLLNRPTVLIDYGQRYAYTGLSRQRIAGPDKQPIVFNSSIDALNFMVRQGWELVFFQVTGTESGAENRLIYLLQRKKRADIIER